MTQRLYSTDQIHRLNAWISLISAATFLTFAALYVAGLEWRDGFIFDSHGYVLGRDFLNFWNYGIAAWHSDPEKYYRPDIYWSLVSGQLGTDYPHQLWSYPPSVMLIAAPFGLMPYLAAYALWTALGIAALTYVICKWTRPAFHPMVLMFMSPAALFCFISGQNSLFTTALIITVLQYLQKRPFLAGLLLGILTLKPQLGLLFPFALIASRNWKAFFAASVTTLLIAFFTALFFGHDIWSVYLSLGIPMQNTILQDPPDIIAALMPTLSMDLHVLGVGYRPAMGFQAIFAVIAIATTMWAMARHRDDPRSWAILITGTILFTPYLMSYDMVMFGWVTAILLQRSDLDSLSLAAILATYALPYIALVMGLAGVAGPSLIPLLLLACLVRSLHQRPVMTQPVAA